MTTRSLLSLLTWALLTAVVWAKPTLPVHLSGQNLSPGKASLVLTFEEAASDVVLTVRATGTAQMAPVRKTLSRMEKGQTLEFSPIQTAPGTFGGAMVHLEGDFGGGRKGRVLTVTLTNAPTAPGVRERRRADQKGAPEVIVLPARTTVRPLER